MSYTTMDIIKKTKHVFKEELTALDIAAVVDAYALYQKTKESAEETKESAEETKESAEETKESAEETKESAEDELQEYVFDFTCLIFKNIQLRFSLMRDLIKHLILQIDQEKYQKIKDEKITVPSDMDTMATVIGCYDEAFSQELQDSFYQIISDENYSEMYCIGKIDILMNEFVATDVNIGKLVADYSVFSLKIKYLACEILGLDTDLEQDSIFEAAF